MNAMIFAQILWLCVKWFWKPIKIKIFYDLFDAIETENDVFYYLKTAI